MKWFEKFLLIALLIMSGTATLAVPVAAAPGSNDSRVAKELAAVRRATVGYHDPATALADGYIALPTCVSVPGEGVGGIHYVNIGSITDPNIDALAPEILLYVPGKKGPRFVGVEYFVPIGGPDAPVPDPAPPAPSLFGQKFDGPMLGHGPGEPPHYDLHVWIWQANPEGIFEHLNPALSC